MKNEIWKSIKGYEGLYEVSNFGRIKNASGLIMKITNHCTGYNIVGLTKGKKQKVYRFHRIVAEHFCEKKEGCDVVNHKNGIKTDNRAENLEWTTVSGNTKHSFQMGLQKVRKGIDSNFAQLNENDVMDIRNKYKTGKFTHKDLSLLYKVSRTCITLIVNNKNWTHI